MGCLGAFLTTAGANLPVRAERHSDDIQNKVMDQIYAFVGIETKNGWTDENRMGQNHDQDQEQDKDQGQDQDKIYY